MAEVVRIDGGADVPATPVLPHNIEAEAALLGALMIDNRLVEDVQLKLRSDHYFEPLHGRIYDAILRMTDKNMVANPVTLRPMFEADEAMARSRRAGVSGTAHRVGRGDHRGARFRAADLRSRSAPLPGRGRARHGRRRARHVGGSRAAVADRTRRG